MLALFLTTLNLGNSTHKSKAMSEINAVGMVCTFPKCAEGIICPHAHLWKCILIFAGIALSVTCAGFPRTKSGKQAVVDSRGFLYIDITIDCLVSGIRDVLNYDRNDSKKRKGYQSRGKCMC